jgi:hypothetical protein
MEALPSTFSSRLSWLAVEAKPRDLLFHFPSRVFERE